MSKLVSGCQPHSSAPSLLQNLARQRRFKQALDKLDLVPFTSEQEDLVSSLDACGLLEHMASGKLTSALITSVYIRRARLQGQRFNAVSDECFAEAIAAARESDNQRAAGSVLGPLAGLPITLKDCFEQKGFDSTVGLVANCAKPSKEDGLFVRVLRESGAIPLARTTVPPFLLSWETSSHLFGITTNPWDEARIPGGSSGGEAAMIAARASPLGFGTDIGGSVRIPAHMTGICSFKCTTRRLTTKGISMQEAPGQNTILSVPGPMAKSVRDLVLSMQVLLSGQMWAEHNGDVYCPPVSWRPDLFNSNTRLRIGLMINNGCFVPAASCARSVHEAAAALERRGHVIVSVGADTFPAVEDFPLWHDRGEWMQEYLQYEPNGDKPARKRSLPTGADVMATNARLERWQQAFLRTWRSLHIDALLCPVTGVPALKHGGTVGLELAISYTTMFNSLQYPAGVVPVTFVKQNEDYYDGPGQDDALNERVRKSMLGSVGLPVAAQVTALPYQDELVLRLMSEIEADILRISPMPSLTCSLSKL